MVNLNSLLILCLVRFAWAEDRISVDTVGTVGTITATAGYSISDNHSPTVTNLQTSSSAELPAFDHDPPKVESSLSDEAYTSAPVALRFNSQSLALRTRQARGKANNNQWQHDGGSGEEKDDIRSNEQLYSVKPQTFNVVDHHQLSSSQLPDTKSGEKSGSSITYGKKIQETDDHGDGGGSGGDDKDDDRRPVFNDWSEEVRVKFDGEKLSRSRKKNKYQTEGVQEKRKPQINKITNSGENKDGWQEVSPNMEIATGYSATVQDHDSSQESFGSSESLITRPIIYNSDGGGGGSISSIENAAQANPQNFNHKQVLSKMNHFDFSNAVPMMNNKAPPAREKRLNYQPVGNALQQLSPVRYAFGGGGGGVQSLKVLAPSVSPVPVKPPKIEQTTANYHSIVVPVPVSHQMYAAIGGNSDMVHGHQLASSTMQQAMMSLPVVHNVFFKTDEFGGGKTMPAIVIPLKPEYLQQLQQQQQQQQQQQFAHGMRVGIDSQNAAGHQQPVQIGAGGVGTKTFHYQQQQQQQQTSPAAYQQQKSKPSKVKKPFGSIKDDQHRVKQPFGLQQQQYFNVPFAGGGGGGHLQHQHGSHHGGHHGQYDPADDSRYGQVTGASVAHPFPTVGHSPLIVKRPHAYGYVPPVKYVNKSPQQQQQQMSAEEQPQNMQPYRATTYHPGFAYLNGPDDDYPYRPIYKDMKKRNDMLLVRTDRRK